MLEKQQIGFIKKKLNSLSIPLFILKVYTLLSILRRVTSIFTALVGVPGAPCTKIVLVTHVTGKLDFHSTFIDCLFRLSYISMIIFSTKFSL